MGCRCTTFSCPFSHALPAFRLVSLGNTGVCCLKSQFTWAMRHQFRDLQELKAKKIAELATLAIKQRATNGAGAGIGSGGVGEGSRVEAKHRDERARDEDRSSEDSHA